MKSKKDFLYLPNHFSDQEENLQILENAMLIKKSYFSIKHDIDKFPKKYSASSGIKFQSLANILKNTENMYNIQQDFGEYFEDDFKFNNYDYIMKEELKDMKDNLDNILRMKIKHYSHDKYKLSSFQARDHELKTLKLMSNQNILIVYEEIKSLIKKNESNLHVMDIKILQLIINIIFTYCITSVSGLRFGKCKSIVRKLDDLEIEVQKNLKQDFFSMNFDTVIKENDSEYDEKDYIESSKRKKNWWKKILSIIKKIKYCLAMICHILHYERITCQNKSKNIDDFMNKKEIFWLDNFLNGNFSAQKRLDWNKCGSIKLQNYQLKLATLNEFINPEITFNKPDKLLHYFKFKTKKWKTIHNTEKFTNKKSYGERQQKIPCKICEKYFMPNKLKLHSPICRKKEELKKELALLYKTIKDQIDDATHITRDINTSIRISKKIIKKLRTKYSELKNEILQLNSNNKITNLNGNIENTKNRAEKFRRRNSESTEYLLLEKILENDENELRILFSRNISNSDLVKTSKYSTSSEIHNNIALTQSFLSNPLSSNKLDAGFDVKIKNGHLDNLRVSRSLSKRLSFKASENESSASSEKGFENSSNSFETFTEESPILNKSRNIKYNKSKFYDVKKDSRIANEEADIDQNLNESLINLKLKGINFTVAQSIILPDESPLPKQSDFIDKIQFRSLNKIHRCMTCMFNYDIKSKNTIQRSKNLKKEIIGITNKIVAISNEINVKTKFLNVYKSIKKLGKTIAAKNNYSKKMEMIFNENLSKTISLAKETNEDEINNFTMEFKTSIKKYLKALKILQKINKNLHSITQKEENQSNYYISKFKTNHYINKYNGNNPVDETKFPNYLLKHISNSDKKTHRENQESIFNNINLHNCHDYPIQKLNNKYPIAKQKQYACTCIVNQSHLENDILDSGTKKRALSFEIDGDIKIIPQDMENSKKDYTCKSQKKNLSPIPFPHYKPVYENSMMANNLNKSEKYITSRTSILDETEDNEIHHHKNMPLLFSTSINETSKESSFGMYLIQDNKNFEAKMRSYYSSISNFNSISWKLNNEVLTNGMLNNSQIKNEVISLSQNTQPNDQIPHEACTKSHIANQNIRQQHRFKTVVYQKTKTFLKNIPKKDQQINKDHCENFDKSSSKKQSIEQRQFQAIKKQNLETEDDTLCRSFIHIDSEIHEANQYNNNLVEDFDKVKGKIIPKNDKVHCKYYGLKAQYTYQEETDRIGSTLLKSSIVNQGYYSDTPPIKTFDEIKESIVKKSMCIDDFHFLKLIGKGAFGRVWLVKRKITGDIYAMKIINISDAMNKNDKNLSTTCLDNLKKEKQIFDTVCDDSVVKAIFTFTHDIYICFVMEYMIGGDFNTILTEYGRLSNEVTKFYIAEIILAVEYLHKCGIVHRDLKPDNILLDSECHSKLADFGLSEIGVTESVNEGRWSNLDYKFKKLTKILESVKGWNTFLLNNSQYTSVKSTKFKEVNSVMPFKTEEMIPLGKSLNGCIKGTKGKINRLIGTPDYMAPEIITGISNNNPSIDWWSLGVLLFEFLVGIPPFNDSTIEKVQDNILNLRIPWDDIPIGYNDESIVPEAKDLIDKLLTLDHNKRLGVNGAEEIMNHPYFEGIDWHDIRKKNAPLKKKPKSLTDSPTVPKEKVNPFDQLEHHSTKQPVSRKNSDMLSSFNMIRYDILDQENQKNAFEAEKNRIDQTEYHNELNMKSSINLYDAVLQCESLFEIPASLCETEKASKQSIT